MANSIFTIEREWPSWVQKRVATLTAMLEHLDGMIESANQDARDFRARHCVFQGGRIQLISSSADNFSELEAERIRLERRVTTVLLERNSCLAELAELR